MDLLAFEYSVKYKLTVDGAFLAGLTQSLSKLIRDAKVLLKFGILDILVGTHSLRDITGFQYRLICILLSLPLRIRSLLYFDIDSSMPASSRPRREAVS